MADIEHTNLNEDQARRLLQEEITILPYNPEWPMLFEQEKHHLFSCVPTGLIRRIEHFGSTAVPGLAAKPIIDMLVEVVDVSVIREDVAPVMQSRGYDYIWRPSGVDSLPYYPFFIRRDERGVRSHHIHMVEGHFQHWERLSFRDHLRANPAAALEYAALKRDLAQQFPNDRVGYMLAKTDFVSGVMDRLVSPRA